MRADIFAESKKFVDSLDRSVLGRFVIKDIKLLYICDEIERHFMQVSTPDNTLFQEFRGDGVTPVNVRQEIAYWWWHYGTPEMKSRINTKKLYDGIYKLTNVANHPEMHDYFVAGIWEISLIERLMQEGIDPEIAFAVTKL